MQYLRFFTFFILVNILIFNSVYTQDFEVAPINIEFDAEPGQSQSQTVTITNHADKPTAFVFSMQDFYLKNDGGLVTSFPNSTKRSCADWLTINPSFVEINSNESMDVTVIIQVPSNEYSARWAMLYVGPTKEQNAFNVDKGLGAAVTIQGRIAIEVTQSPKSNKKYKAKINNFVEKTKPGDFDRIFTANIDNIGDKFLKCKVYLIATNIQTEEETKYEPFAFRSFPETSRNIELTLPGGLPSGKYALAAILDYGNKASLEGVQVIIDIP